MLRVTSVAIVAFAAVASAQPTISIEVSPAVISLGEDFELNATGSFDRGTALRYRAIQLSTTGAVIGTVACNKAFTFQRSGGRISRWAAPKTGKYQITVMLESDARNPSTRSPPSASSPFRSVRPRDVTIGVTSTVRYPSIDIALTATGQLPPGARYIWGLDSYTIVDGNVVAGTIKLETPGPTAVWTVPFGPTYRAVHVDVLDGDECSLIASGTRASIN